MKRKILAAILCLSMTAGMLAGCGSTENTQQESSASGTAETAGVSPEAAAETPAAKAENGEPVTLDIFINMSWYPVDTFTGKIPDKIKEITGIDLDVTIATDDKQLGVMIASGELPDLVFTDDTGGVLSSMSNPNVCYSLDEMEEMTGVTFRETENYEERKKIAQTFSSDGEAYTLLNNYNTQEDWENVKVGAPGQTCIYYRKDLLDAAGIAVPTNLDEFLTCCEQIREYYPDITPLGVGGYWKMQPFENWTGVTAGTYDPEKNEYRYNSSTEEYRDFLKYANTLYRNGYIKAEDYAVENEADGHQMAYNNGCIFYTWYLSYSNLSQLSSNSVDENAEWAVLNPLGEAPIDTSKGWAGAFVSRNCENVEAAATIISYLNTLEGSRLSRWGIEGDDYVLNEDGTPEFSQQYLEARDDSDKWYHEYNVAFYFGASTITDMYMNYCGLNEDMLSQFSSYAEGYKNFPEIGIAEPTSTSDEGVIKSKLDEIKTNYEAKVIFTDSDEAFESAYEEFMNANEKTGIDQYNNYMSNRIAEIKEEFGL